MDLKASPYSAASTHLAVSPATKPKFSRKFRINLTDDKKGLNCPKTEEIALLEKKLLRYRRKHKEKTIKLTAQTADNEALIKEIERNKWNLRLLNAEHAEELQNTKNLTEIQNEIKAQTSRLESAIQNNDKKPIYVDSKSPAHLQQLESLQEELFSSSKKASDLERLLMIQQKKNLKLSNEIRDLKIEISSGINN
jgi:hypothetical protein